MAKLAQRNPLFPYAYSALVAGLEHTFYASLRARTLAPARGKLLVVGLGPGQDLRHIPPSVTSIAAVEPDPVMRRKAAKLAGKLGVELELVDGVGEQLPFDDASFDTVLCSLVLCSVRDVEATLGEIRRVIRPDGQLLVLEHVRAADGSLAGRLQDRIAPAWSVAASGCQVNRRTAQLLADAGFDVSDLAGEPLVSTLMPLMPHIRGRIPVVGGER